MVGGIHQNQGGAVECEELHPGQEDEPLGRVFRTMDQWHLKHRNC